MESNELKRLILAADDIKVEKVEVPEWGDAGKHIWMRSMTGTERDDHEIQMVKLDKAEVSGINYVNVRSRTLVKVLVNKDRKQIFEEKDIVALGLKNGKVLDRLYDKARELSGMEEAAKKKLEKNS